MLIYISFTHGSLYDWAERGAERPIFFWMCPSPHSGLYLLFIILVKHSSSRSVFKLCAPLLDYFIRKPAVTKYISAVFRILLFLSFFFSCTLQRKWTRRLEFLIMRKPLHPVTFSKSSLLLSGLNVHFPQISSALRTCSIKWNRWIKHDYANI